MNKYFLSHCGTKACVLSPKFELTTFKIKIKPNIYYSFAVRSLITQFGLTWLHISMKEVNPFDFANWMDNYWTFHENLLNTVKNQI
jgi:hypothetical protein